MTVPLAPGDLVQARGREWVALPSPREGVLALRPLSGSENDTVILDPALEFLPVEPARFDIPDNAKVSFGKVSGWEDADHQFKVTWDE